MKLVTSAGLVARLKDCIAFCLGNVGRFKWYQAASSSLCGIVWSSRIDVDSRDEGPVIEAIKQVGAQVVGVTGVCLVA